MGEILEAILNLIGSLASVERRNRARLPVVLGLILLLIAVVALLAYTADSLSP